MDAEQLEQVILKRMNENPDHWQDVYDELWELGFKKIFDEEAQATRTIDVFVLSFILNTLSNDVQKPLVDESATTYAQH